MPVNALGGGGVGNGGNTTIITNPPFDPSGLQSQIDAQATTITTMQTTITTRRP